MDAIMISANPKMVNVADALSHLQSHGKLYWEVGFAIDKSQFAFPIYCYIHVNGRQVEYRAIVDDILPYLPAHYEDASVKPASWRDEWRRKGSLVSKKTWRYALVMTEIIAFSCSTYHFTKSFGGPIEHPPRRYVRVIAPDKLVAP